jgi:hypothetical protein
MDPAVKADLKVCATLGKPKGLRYNPRKQTLRSAVCLRYNPRSADLQVCGLLRYNPRSADLQICGLTARHGGVYDRRPPDKSV